MRKFIKALWMGALLTGCGSAYYDPYYYDTAYYDPYYSDYDAASAYAYVDPYGAVYTYETVSSAAKKASPKVGLAIDLEGVADGIVTATPARYSPAGCATATASGTSVTIAYANCTGPQGLGALNGSVTTQLSESNGQLVLTSTSDNFTVDGDPFIVDSVTTVTSVGGQRSASVVSQSRNPDRTDSRNFETTVTWQQGSNCVEVNGAGTSTRDGRTANTTITGYQRCFGECPSAGTIKVTDGDKTVTTTFDGTNQLKIDAKDGDSKTIDLVCQ